MTVATSQGSLGHSRHAACFAIEKACRPAVFTEDSATIAKRINELFALERVALLVVSIGLGVSSNGVLGNSLGFFAMFNDPRLF